MIQLKASPDILILLDRANYLEHGLSEQLLNLSPALLPTGSATLGKLLYFSEA